MSLPLPDSDALAASHALQQEIAAHIEEAGGAIPFSRFMELALYAPRLGYYSGGAAKLGASGDFTTAPEISPLFGQALARAAAAIIAQSAPNIIEFGAGTGKLARDVLTALAEEGVQVNSYTIIELSGELRARQQEALKDFPQVEWRDGFPDAFNGVVLANEVLDAMPVELVLKTDDGWRRQMVTIEEGRFAYVQAQLDDALAAQLARQIPDADTLPAGYLTELHPVACGFMGSLATMFKGNKGAAILLDYGFPAHEYYVDQRSGGTLMCHYRHHSHPDPFFLPGLQDITAHVDFTAMALAAQDAGLPVLGYLNQSGFLLACGIGDLLLRTDPDDAVRYLPQSKAVHKLVAPSEMGELFKVLIVGHAVDLPDAIMRADRRHRL
ncbi:MULTISPECIES: class I SAM-dependent methyltransferase [unclassified Massilia]|uniref:class I SAM-dependent methyltransferase n=1 Tax=unclassified Massilia TaxID=2609279 RepID=UPI001783927A|nr:MULTISPECIES: SAM-dependent methyltransferase [unclassified Massilia]MBD8532437.1 SAM-dependent methyltransferase [Massilia sp. CFBP 13647]MBD8675737.1 SAM-dependent methyltransferase [Massilia sp. CFBP 13721]